MEPDRHLRPCSGSRFAPAHVHIGDKEDIQALITSPEPRNHAVLSPRARPRRGLCIRFGHSRPPAVSWTRGTRGAAGPLPGTGRIEDCLAPQMGTSCAAGDIPAPTGTFLYRRGHSTPPGTEFLSPNTHLVPAQDDTHPAAQNVPARSRTPPPGDTPHQRGHSGAGGGTPVPAGAFDAVGDRIPVPQRASCPRPRRHAPSRAECPRRAPLRRCRTTWAVPGGPSPVRGGDQ